MFLQCWPRSNRLQPRSRFALMPLGSQKIAIITNTFLDWTAAAAQGYQQRSIAAEASAAAAAVVATVQQKLQLGRRRRIVSVAAPTACFFVTSLPRDKQ